GRFATGEWYVSAVSFGMSAPEAQLRLARQRVIKERLLYKAELENSQHAHLRQAAFPAESHQESWAKDVHHGDWVIKDAIETAHEHASEDAEMLKNPVTWVDMGLDVLSLGVTAGVPKFTGAEKLEHADEHLKGEAGGAWQVAHAESRRPGRTRAAAQAFSHRGSRTRAHDSRAWPGRFEAVPGTQGDPRKQGRSAAVYRHRLREHDPSRRPICQDHRRNDLRYRDRERCRPGHPDSEPDVRLVRRRLRAPNCPDRYWCTEIGHLAR